MLFKIKELFASNLRNYKSRELNSLKVEVACAALLIHCSKLDGKQSIEETTYLKSLLSKHFNLSHSEIELLVNNADMKEKNSIDLHQFTRVLHDNMNREDRIEMVQMLWEMANSDGNIDSEERHMVSLTAQLLEVELQDSVAARQKARAKKKFC
ncbi:MAG: TerB family tellurite resistance protein [Hyphomicrobiaceae bacterium]|nr:TerB family tellurite resistance protein [Hyphomicrobiaceae bacterium]